MKKHKTAVSAAIKTAAGILNEFISLSIVFIRNPENAIANPPVIVPFRAIMPDSEKMLHIAVTDAISDMRCAEGCLNISSAAAYSRVIARSETAKNAGHAQIIHDFAYGAVLTDILLNIPLFTAEMVMAQ